MKSTARYISFYMIVIIFTVYGMIIDKIFANMNPLNWIKGNKHKT
jgi:hypothetical protein